MNTYKILEVSQIDETVTTKVEYTFGEEVVIIDVSHFAPQSQEDIDIGISNRALSELSKMENIKIAEDVKETLPVGEVLAL